MPNSLKLKFKDLAPRIFVLSPQKNVVVVEKDQIVIILYLAYLLDFLLDFWKLCMEIILLFKPNPMVEFAGLCFNV